MTYYLPAEVTPWLRPATHDDALRLAPKMRAVDADECRLLSGQSSLEALESGLAQGMCLAFCHPKSGEVHALFGLALGRVIWLLSDEAMFTDRTMRRLMTRHGRFLMTLLFSQDDVADVVFNITFQRNTRVLRWLTWLGATCGLPLDYGQGQRRERVVPFFFQRRNHTEEPCAHQPL